MEGSIILGKNPNLIYFRIAKQTIGKDQRVVQNESIRSKSEKKEYDEEEWKYYCRDCFDKLINSVKF